MPHPSLAAFAVLLSLAGCQTVRRLEQRPLPAQSPYAEEEDSDRDGLRDSEERELAERFAPVMILHGKDWARPASATWFLTESAQRPDNPALLRGRPVPSEWPTYVHVFPSADRQSIHLQYWFFFPYNDGPWVFDHSGDWEHITVELNAQREPQGVWAARHSDNRPGVWRAWPAIRKIELTHPEILTARGSHASYFDRRDARVYDRVGVCAATAEPCEHIRWFTWKSGGLVQLGERNSSLYPDIMHHARWGKRGWLPGTDAPRSPPFQRGWCAPDSPACR